MQVGELLKLLDQLGIANNTVVKYSTDNGPHYNAWPDAAPPFRSEKNSNWDSAYRVPTFVRWPGHYPAGVTVNGLVAHETGWRLRRRRRRAGHQAEPARGLPDIGRTYRNYLDGYNMKEYVKGTTKESPRKEFWYFNDDGQGVATAGGAEVGLPRKPRLGV